MPMRGVPAPFGALPGIFLRGPEKSKKKTQQTLPIFLGGPMGPIDPVWGHVLVSFKNSSPSLMSEHCRTYQLKVLP